MRRLFVLLATAGTLLMPQARADCHDHPVTLREMHDCYRVLLVFAPNPNNAQLQTQFQQLQSDASGFRERNLLLVPVVEPGGMARLPQSDLPTATLTPEDEEAARRRFHRHSGFQVVLIGKDGAEKLRDRQPITSEKLYGAIDAMPMRKDEMKRQ